MLLLLVLLRAAAAVVVIVLLLLHFFFYDDWCDVRAHALTHLLCFGSFGCVSFFTRDNIVRSFVPPRLLFALWRILYTVVVPVV